MSANNWPFTTEDDAAAIPVAGSTGASSSSSGSGSGSGSIGQQVGQRVSGGTGTQTNPVPTATWYPPAVANHGKITWNSIGQLGSAAKQVTKKKVQYVIVKADRTTLELRELPTITPQEMIGLSKFISLVSTYTILVLAEQLISYNFNISWSDLIVSLGITKHFAAGLAPGDYDDDASEVIDILLYDPQ